MKNKYYELKLMQMSWVYDINFKKNYIKTIYNSMDKREKVNEVYNNIKEFIENEKSLLQKTFFCNND
mgnify:CR=1 FL=1